MTGTEANGRASVYVDMVTTMDAVMAAVEHVYPALYYTALRRHRPSLQELVRLRQRVWRVASVHLRESWDRFAELYDAFSAAEARLDELQRSPGQAEFGAAIREFRSRREAVQTAAAELQAAVVAEIDGELGQETLSSPASGQASSLAPVSRAAPLDK